MPFSNAKLNNILIQESSSKKTLAQFMLERRQHTMPDMMGIGVHSSEDQRGETRTADGLWREKKSSSFVNDGPVILDVGGDRFTTSRKVLAKFPNTR